MARQKNSEGTNRKRTIEVRVKLSPGIAEAFAGIAEIRGLLPATLAAVVVGEYCEKHAFNEKLQHLAVLDSSKRLVENFDEAKIAQMLSTLKPAIFSGQLEVSEARPDGSSAGAQVAAHDEGGAAAPA